MHTLSSAQVEIFSKSSFNSVYFWVLIFSPPNFSAPLEKPGVSSLFSSSLEGAGFSRDSTTSFLNSSSDSSKFLKIRGKNQLYDIKTMKNTYERVPISLPTPTEAI